MKTRAREHAAPLLREMKRHWQLYVFLLLPVVWLLVFCYYPMFGVQIAFKDFSASKGIWGSPWVGFKHFENFFTSYKFWQILWNTLKLSLYSLAVSFPLSILFALLLNALRSLRYKKFVQNITYIPHFISTVVVVGILMQIFSPTTGLYGHIFRLLGGEGYPPDILGQAGSFIHIYVWSGIWEGLGWGSIIYVAALSSVDPELHEAAMIDGATRLKRLLYIDLPSIIPTISIQLILSAGGILNVGFEKVFLLQNNLNLSTSEIISTYIYKVGLASGSGSFSYGAAVGLFNSLVNGVILVLVNRLAGRLGDEGASLW